MKVISGSLKGREILGYKIDGTRPTMDRVKESIFGMLEGNVSNSIVLDLFAGSGNYGIEAISLNAKLVYFNDINKECIRVIKKNIEKFKIDNKCILYNLDYLKCLKLLKEKSLSFDLIFLDPPYKLHVLKNILNFIDQNSLLNINGFVVVELQDEDLEEEYLSLRKIKERKYGDKKVYIYKNIGGICEIK